MRHRVVVAGALANKLGSGGEAWVRMSWVRGFEQLGCLVDFVEQIDSSLCLDESGAPSEPERSEAGQYFTSVCDSFGLQGRATLVIDDGASTIGRTIDELEEVLRDTDLLVNISGHLRHRGLTSLPRRTALVDIDPGFTQIWHDQGVAAIAHHDHYFTIGENIGRAGCTIPTCGLRWLATRQPVVLADWPVAPDAPFDRFTTIANWRGPYGPLTIDGKTLGLKVHEFRKVLSLPRAAGASFELALNIDPSDAADRAALDEHGWRIVDPSSYCRTPDAFREYVAGSSGEFSVAQGVYVDTNSGWFSDRSVRYLASGRPVLVQECGFTENIPSGEGIVAFRSLDDAVRGARGIVEEYARHRRAARRIAEEYFESERVLTRFLELAQ